MIDIDELRRAHLNSPQGGLSLPDNWHIERYDKLKVGTFRALLDELEALRAANQWLPIADAPHGYIDVILYQPESGRNNDVSEGYFEDDEDGGEGRWIWSSDSSPALPTHYRLLPPPPQD